MKTTDPLRQLLKHAAQARPLPKLTKAKLDKAYAKLIKQAADCGTDIACCRCGQKLWVLGRVPARMKITCDECKGRKL